MLTLMLRPATLALPLAAILSALPAAVPATAGPLTAATAEPLAYGGHGRTDASGLIVLAAGDVPSCESYPSPAPVARATGHLAWDLRKAAGNTASVDFLGLGDENNGGGTYDEFVNCYGNTDWKRLYGITYPSPGNHEYLVPNAADYFRYFADALNRPGVHGRPSHYSFDAGGWHFISLDSECMHAENLCSDQKEKKEEQAAWLTHDLQDFRRSHEGDPRACVLAYWHRPLFSSSSRTPLTLYAEPDVLPWWKSLYEYGAALVLNGHEHGYERFAPQKWDGTLDPGNGIREIVAATGGAHFYPFHKKRAPNSEERFTDTPGVLELTLEPGSYGWAFYSTASRTEPVDSGSGTCPRYRPAR